MKRMIACLLVAFAVIGGAVLSLPGADASVATIHAIQVQSAQVGANPALYAPVLTNLVPGANTALLSANPAAVYEPRDNMVRVIVDWVSDTNGAASFFVPGPVSGVLLKAYAFPGAGGLKPSDNYDVTLKAVLPDPDDVDLVADDDLAASGLTNLDADAAVDVKSYWPTTVIPIPERIQVEIANAGSAKGGRLILYIYRNP